MVADRGRGKDGTTMVGKAFRRLGSGDEETRAEVETRKETGRIFKGTAFYSALHHEARRFS
jgi:hypothetical protein